MPDPETGPDTQAIATTGPAAGPAAGLTPLDMISMALHQGHSPEKLNALLDFAERVKKTEAAERFAESLAAFQAECPQILKERTVKNKSGGEMYKFASYDDVKKAVGPLMQKYGIVATFSMNLTGGVMLTTCRIRVGSHCEETTLPIAIPQGMNTNKAQDFGIAVTYAKRYALCAALDIVTTDDDDDGGSLGDYITAEQIGEINGLIAQCEKAGRPVNFKAFLKWLAVESLDKLYQRDIYKATEELKRKLAQAQKQQEANK
jgi:hypothetical protein